MRPKFPPLLLLLLLLLPIAAPLRAEPADYLVRVPAADADAVEVRARFALAGDTVGMYVVASPDLANGTADLVEDLRARDAAGRPLALEALGLGDWRVAGAAAGDVVEVRYRVRLDHDDHAWGPGIDEVAYRTADGLFFTGHALFVVPLGGLEDGARLRFELPAGWRLSHPWDEADGVLATDAEGLVRNCFFAGTHDERTVRVEGFTLVLATGRDLAAADDLFVETMRPALAGAKAVFGGLPARDRYLVVVNRYPRSDGGAFAGSYSLLIDGPVDRTSSAIWGHGMVHEVLHFWNGVTLTAAGPREEWFREGVTDYLTVLLRARTGQERRGITYRKLEDAHRRVLLARLLMGNREPLDVAGADKQANRMLVYGGGLLVGLALDGAIRQGSGDTRSLADLVAALYAEHAHAGTAYTVEDVERTASRLAGADLAPFFDRYVRGPGMLDLDAVLDPFGLRADTMLELVFVSEDPAATPEQVRRRDDLLGAAR